MRLTPIDAPADVSVRGRFRLLGDPRRPGGWSVPDLRAIPQREAEVTFACRTSGMRRHHFAGPLLVDVARAAEPTFDPSERKDRLRFLVSVLGADGHHAVLSWGEIDPEFGNVEALVGVRMDGRDLDEQGPHLVVPGDRCGGRQISRIVEIRVCADARLWGAGG
ncbi:molybdopterin-binding protein [Sphaerisporangium corydalis]|uniref:Molybdopterin-dependent oxidoreductase n=1 Tax=Sphaerisporangium corydalis TaxID=1441875 RepID=A0ABV9ER06_9ACTN|nr:hypothetical protein [Sphaerisporangium corydalis]